jgi:hypothetical protein
VELMVQKAAAKTQVAPWTQSLVQQVVHDMVEVVGVMLAECWL